jgi:uncharacterized protein YkwD
MARRVAPLVCVLAAVVTVAALLPAGASAKGMRQSTALAIDKGVLTQLNQIRAAHHLVPLSLSPSLSAAATQHSRDMVARGYFAHNSSNGLPFWKRIQGFYPQGGFGYWSVGENLFWTLGTATSAQSMNAWMASPDHRANILDPAWRQIGISTVSSADAPGAYGNHDVTVITTDFGVRHG